MCSAQNKGDTYIYKILSSRRQAACSFIARGAMEPVCLITQARVCVYLCVFRTPPGAFEPF